MEKEKEQGCARLKAGCAIPASGEHLLCVGPSRQTAQWRTSAALAPSAAPLRVASQVADARPGLRPARPGLRPAPSQAPLRAGAQRGRQGDLWARAPRAALRDERRRRVVDLPQAAAPGARVPRVQSLQARPRLRVQPGRQQAARGAGEAGGALVSMEQPAAHNACRRHRSRPRSHAGTRACLGCRDAAMRALRACTRSRVPCSPGSHQCRHSDHLLQAQNKRSASPGAGAASARPRACNRARTPT